jgi:hypothetical protein
MYNHIRRVTQAFRNLRDLYIRWPGEEERRTIRREAQKQGFPGAVGAVDGSYIPIMDRPRKNPMAFRCRKKFWAVSAIINPGLTSAHCWLYDSGTYKLLLTGTGRLGPMTSAGLGARPIEPFGATPISGPIARTISGHTSTSLQTQVCIFYKFSLRRICAYTCI